jgi:hypothetical protein
MILTHSRYLKLVLASTLGWLLLVAPVHLAAEEDEQPLRFDKDVRPILAAKCLKCHGEKIRRAELDLRSAESIRKGSESGSLLEPGSPDESLLWEMIEGEVMPPEDEPRLTEAESRTLHDWIAAGAHFEKSQPEADQQVTQHDILPILQLRCTVCHGQRRREAELDLRTPASILKGGRSGPAIIPGKPEESLLLKQITSGAMPPRRMLVEASVKPMPENEIEQLTQWIREGAPVVEPEASHPGGPGDPLVSAEDREFWAFQPPRKADPPAVDDAHRVRNPIDAFLLSRLEAAGLGFSPEADRLTLVRRAYFDVIGLPPTPEEVQTFLADERPDAYDRLIDRLLDSPRHGERWARFWLDLAGYSDSEGVQNSDLVRPAAYRYRDYVIRSLNADKPYDRFLLEQIAGDELADYESAENVTRQMVDNLIATGFLRMTPDGTFANITNFVPDRLEIIADEIEVLGSAVLGLTVKCARCHTHKFDPIPHRDYYRLTAILKSALDEHDWLPPTPRGDPQQHGLEDRYLTVETTADRTVREAHNGGLQQQIDQLQAALKQKEESLQQAHVDRELAALPEVLQDDLRRMVSTPVDRRTAVDTYLAEKFEASLRVTAEQLMQQNAEFKAVADQTGAEVQSLAKQMKQPPLIRALWDRGSPSPSYVLRRGNYLTPGRPVQPGVLSVLSDGPATFPEDSPESGPSKTGRRLALARWLTRGDHPLTSRVMVNRLWHQHFGFGIVTTLDNFGVAGARPSHPELLDWLAVQFVEQGWSMKSIHRLIMTSSAYRQESRVSEVALVKDPDNRLLSRMPLRRLTGEALRDALLAVSGKLDPTPFGPPDGVDAREDGLITAREGKQGWRRSIFVLQRRTQPLTILENFDLPQMNPNCVQRSESTVAPQALHLMNNRLVSELAGALAHRVRETAGDDPDAQLRTAYQIALGRTPSAQEQQTAMVGFQGLQQHWSKELVGARIEIAASSRIWIRESAPDTVYENDLVSVWSGASRDGARRYGLIEFDLAQLEGHELSGARLELGSLNDGPLRQHAALIPPGIAKATWSSYQRNQAAQSVPLEGLGHYDLASGEGPAGNYVRSQPATAFDLQQLASLVEKKGRLTLVLTAAEDGKDYSRDWDDGRHHSTRGNPPRLVVRDTSPNEEEVSKKALESFCHALMNSAGFLYID